MRLIDAEQFKEYITAEACLGNISSENANNIMKLIDRQRTMISGEVREAELTYQKIPKITPTSVEIEPNWNKIGNDTIYSCPVCAAVGNSYQIVERGGNCPACGVNIQCSSNKN